METESGAVMFWGPNALRFDSREDVEAFASELGCRAVSYYPTWRTPAIRD
jgi:hypothetical protein